MLIMERLLLVDFMFLWNRIFYVSSGDYYERVMKVIEKLHNSNYYSKKIIVLDGKNGTSKHKALLEDYKAGRSDKTEVYSKIDLFIKEASDKYPSVMFVRGDDYEADEVITNFIPLYNRKYEVYIYSGDKDLIQLLRYNNVFIGDRYHRGIELVPWTREEALGKFEKATGGRLDNFVDLVKFRAFRGDASDNIPAAIPRITSAKIFELIENCWKDSTLTPSTTSNIMNYVKGTSLEDKMVQGIKDLERNWKLMYLSNANYEQVLKNTKRLTICK